LFPAFRSEKNRPRAIKEALVFDIKVKNFFNFRSDEYADLFANSGATPFQHPLWLDRLYATLAPQLGAEPLVIVVRSSANGRLRMILPLLRQRRALMSVVEFADLGVSDYAAPVCDDEIFELILRDEAACREIRNALKPYDLLRFQKLRGNTRCIEQLLSVPPAISMNMSAHVATLQHSYPEWRANSIGPSYRKELDKKRRQLHRKGRVLFECSSSADAIKSTLESMRQYRLPRFQHAGDRDLLQQPLYFGFYLDVALSGAAAGLARTYTLSMDGRTIAGVMGLAHRGQFLVLLGGFDHASFKNQSIGALMFEDVAHDCIARGDTVLDFTIGDEPYKQLFGAQPIEMWMFTKTGSQLGFLASFVVAQVPGAKKVVKRFIERRPTAIAGWRDDNAPLDTMGARSS
jgi:CelD/BcsL family acetyltransferase involved in cellulose biosynthesis